MRGVISTALVALAVSVAATATVSVVAQSEPDSVSPAALSSANVDRVDGRHAVGARATKAQRAGKLVATDSRGYLPSDILSPRPVTQITISTATDYEVLSAGEYQSISAECASGKVVGGGFAQSDSRLVFTDSAPGSATSWYVWAMNPTADEIQATVYATCLTAKPASALQVASRATRITKVRAR